MITLRALRPLYNPKYCKRPFPIAPMDIFEVSEQDAEHLEAKGLAERVYERKLAPAYHNKMRVTAENKEAVSSATEWRTR